jgi:preprotein translocase subunit YajC
MSTLWQSFCLIAQQEAPAGGAAAEPAGGSGINTILPLLPWIMIGVLFYLMMVRPERRKRAELDTMLKNLKKNDRVVTIGGIFGTVVQASEGAEDVTLRVDESNNTRIRVLRSSISRVLSTDGASEPKGT